MKTKRKLALAAAFLLVLTSLMSFGGLTAIAGEAQPAADAGNAISSANGGSSEQGTGNGGSSGSGSSSSSQPPANTGGLEVASYRTHVAGTEISQITPGMRFSLELRLHDTRLKDFPYGVPRPRGKMNTSSFTPAEPNSVAYPRNLEQTATGFDYTLEFVAVYSGKGNTFQADIYYEDQYGNIAPLTKITLDLNTAVETPSSSSGSDTSTVVKGTGFALKEATYGDSSVVAGKEFELKITMLATNGTDSIENVSATLLPDKEFTLASGVSTIYYGTATPGQNIPLVFEMKAAADAKDGSYKVGLKLQGVSSKTGSEVTTEVSLSIPITQADRLVISNVTLPDFINAGMEDGTGHASINLVNMGKSEISNVMVDIVGEGIYTSEGKTYLGTFTPGTQNSADFTVMGDTPGQYDAEVVVTYENARGESHELREAFSVEVGEAPMPMPDTSMMPDMPESTGMPVWGWLLIGLGVVAAAIAAVSIVMKKRKHARDAALEDDDDADI